MPSCILDKCSTTDLQPSPAVIFKLHNMWRCLLHSGYTTNECSFHSENGNVLRGLSGSGGGGAVGREKDLEVSGNSHIRESRTLLRGHGHGDL
jgi:hypothetical protein